MIRIELRENQFRAHYANLPQEPADPEPGQLRTTLYIHQLRLFSGYCADITLPVKAATSAEPQWQNISANLPGGLYEYRYYNGIEDVIGEHLTVKKAVVKVEQRTAVAGREFRITVDPPMMLKEGDLKAKIKQSSGGESMEVPIIPHGTTARFFIGLKTNCEIVLGEQLDKMAERE